MAGQLRLSKEQWESVRADRESGMTFPELSVKYKVTTSAISKRARAGGWDDGDGVKSRVQKRVAEKVAGIVVSQDPKKLNEAIEAEADRIAEIQKRHRSEPNAIRERLYAGLKLHKEATKKEDKQIAFEDLKAAKIASETMMNIHKLERQAWDLDTPVDVTSMSIEQLELMAKGKLPKL